MLMYCPSCGEEVETFLMLEESGEVHHCFICSSALTGPSAEQAFHPLDTILVAEDSAVFREVLRDKLEEKGLARNIEMTGDGEEFLTLFTSRMFHNLPISLCILDIRMPLFNGLNAALALRSVEKGFEKKRKIPVLFFSSVKCDENLKEILRFCSPARYINKGASGSPEQLAERLVQVVHRLIMEAGRK